MAVYDDTNRPSTVDEYESDLRWALDGHHAARDKFLRTEDGRDLPEIARWAVAVTEIAQAVTIVRDNTPMSEEQAARLDAMLTETVESRQAARIMRRIHDDDVPVDWDNPLDLYPDIHLLDIPTIWDTETQADWLVEPLIAARRQHAVYAKAGEGKSWTILAAAVALATGHPFLGMAAGPPRHVLYVDYEMTVEDLAERLEGFGYGPGNDWSHLHYSLLPDIPPLDSADGGQRVVDVALGLAAEVVVIDTTGRATVGKESDSDTIRDFYRHTGKRLKQAGIALVRIDHAGKDMEKGQRGTSAKNDDVDIVWEVVRSDSGQKWTARKRRTLWVPPSVAIDVAEGEDGVWTFSTDGATWPAGTRELADLLDRLGVPLDMGRPTIKRDFGDRVVARTEVLSAAIKYRRERAEVVSPGPIDVPEHPPEQAPRDEWWNK